MRGETAAPHDAAAWTMPYGDLPWEAPKSVLAISQEIIGRKATTGDGVIVGRAGAYIHRDQDDILKVFLVAQESLRVAETPESLGLSKADARERSSRSTPNRAA